MSVMQDYPATWPESLPVNERVRAIGKLAVEHGLRIWNVGDFSVTFGKDAQVLYDDYLQPRWAVRGCDVSYECLHDAGQCEIMLDRLARKL